LNATFQYNIEDEKLANGRFLGKISFKYIEFGFQTTFRMQKSQSRALIVLVKSAASGCDLDLVHVEDEVSNGIELVDEFDCFTVPPSGLVREPPERLLVHIVDCESDHCGFPRLRPDPIRLSLLLVPLPPECAEGVRLTCAMHLIWPSIPTL
jgi:hypothetical protein